MKRFDVADFFCGAGGFSEGFRQKGFDVVFALDNWKPAIDTHRLNHPHSRHALMNILELDTPEKIDEVVPDVDVLIGSPPCVSFSGSNKAGKADKSLGIRLIEAYLRIILWKKSKGKLKYWLLENVPNSEKYIKEEYSWEELGLPGKGPDLTMQERSVFNAADYGAPQTRKRFVCGDYPMPAEVCDETGWTKLSAVLESLTNPLSSKIPESIKDPSYGFKIMGTELTDHFYDSRVEDFEWKKAKRMKEDHGFMGRMSFPENADRPSRTVMATRSASTRESIILQAYDDDGNDVGYRLPTIREIATFMSFPITYQFEAGSEGSKYRLVGNAVCAKISGALAEAILLKEGIKPPEEFLHLPDARVSVDLTGTKRAPKIPRPRKNDAKFAVHIPYLKIRSFRVELSNKDSDFMKDDLRWSCTLHHGSGKGASRWEVPQSEVKALLTSQENFDAFAEDVTCSFENLFISPQQLHESYVMNGESKQMTPDKALAVMREVVDRHYPADVHVEVDNRKRIIRIEKDVIPLRILAGLYACNHFLDKMS